MNFELALRLSEILLGWTLVQQAIEHLSLRKDWILYASRLIIGVFLIAGLWTGPVLVLGCVTMVWHLHRWQGPYNGGADRMGALILICLTLARILPGDAARELAFAYLAGQLVLSYFISGAVKIVNPEWRSGRALRDVFAFSAYPTSESYRRLAAHPRVMFLGGWGVMAFELAFPIFLLNGSALLIALGVAAMFHLANAVFFGLNRFFWTWIAAYPALIWLQERLLG